MIRVDWDCLEDTILKIGFVKPWVRVVMLDAPFRFHASTMEIGKDLFWRGFDGIRDTRARVRLSALC